jgi:hypothetical protein
MVGVFLFFSHVKNAQCTDSYMKKGGQIKMSILTFFPARSRQTFSHLLVGERLRQLHTLSSLHDSSCLGGIRKLCKEANDMFNALNVSKE